MINNNRLIIDEDTELKVLEICDAEELYDLIESCRIYLKEWLPWLNGNKSVADTKYFIEVSKRQFILRNGFQLGIWYREKIAGVIGFSNIDWSNKEASIGYWLGEKYQGKGIMTRAVLKLVEYGFSELYLNRIEIRCAEGNYKSRAIPEKLGFINEGIAEKREWLYDHYVSHVIYGLSNKRITDN